MIPPLLVNKFKPLFSAISRELSPRSEVKKTLDQAIRYPFSLHDKSIISVFVNFVIDGKHTNSSRIISFCILFPRFHHFTYSRTSSPKPESELNIFGWYAKLRTVTCGINPPFCLGIFSCLPVEVLPCRITAQVNFYNWRKNFFSHTWFVWE